MNPGGEVGCDDYKFVWLRLVVRHMEVNLDQEAPHWLPSFLSAGKGYADSWERKDINGLTQLWTMHVRQDVTPGVAVAGPFMGQTTALLIELETCSAKGN